MAKIASIWHFRAANAMRATDMVFKRLFGKSDPRPARHWFAPPGKRIYAIGDIHGRLDLLNQLLAQIEADSAARGPAEVRLISLGDLVDRGPDSRGVIERWMQLKAQRPDTVLLAGNHEELMIRVWDGEHNAASTFHRAGARATLMSYGAGAEEYDGWDFHQMSQAAYRLIPEAHITFLRNFANWHVEGDYAFVHAGIRPGVHIEDQDKEDLRWIRGEFTRSEQDHGLMIIHGHTIREEIDERANRIGIDTGAYATGVLTAIGLEGSERWYIQTK